MDAFEDLVARLLRHERYWTRQNYKIDLTKPEKVAIGLPSMPRPDIDILAYQPGPNRVLWVECKSYLDSGGVHMSAFDGKNSTFARRFRVFTDDNYRAVVTAALKKQVVAHGLALADPTVEYWLVAGNIASKQLEPLQAHFDEHGWQLRDRTWIRATMQQLSKTGYEDDVLTMATKLLGGAGDAD